MKLLSHGPGSDLLQHLQEVCLAADTLEERIICACHDIGKATVIWQNYAKEGFINKSPHKHAIAGGLLSAQMIKTLQNDNWKIWAIIALHTSSAHHSHLGLLENAQLHCQHIVNDQQAKFFFLSEIAKLLPEIDKKNLEEAWSSFVELVINKKKMEQLDSLIESTTEAERLEVFVKARSILGRLCYQDHQSAAKQSQNSESVTNHHLSFPDRTFSCREKRNYNSTNEINILRTTLKNEFHKVLDKSSTFYFIDAPTGLGKTETMLSGAEKLVEKNNYQRIIFTVPQVSIADQIYEEYFKNKANSQIWNYLRQEKDCVKNDQELSNWTQEDIQLSLDIATQPFSESYNVTTFNQILLAMCHPLRTRCIRSIGLKNAVIIMDEFHKLPLLILPYFFRIAEEYAKHFNCCFILGSATPLGKYEYLSLENSISIPYETVKPIYQHCLINHRRQYARIGSKTVDELASYIKEYHTNNSDNLLVVVNLVAKGTFPLLRKLTDGYNPELQLQNLQNNSSERTIVFLDGLVPPIMRRKVVLACKKAMKNRPVTLITTQMVEVGVDLDFDHGLIDFQGIAATIQRGGRVGREGRKNGSTCTVELFSLIDDEGKSSYDILTDVQEKHDARMNNIRFVADAKIIKKIIKKEKRFISNDWQGNLLYDSDLIAKQSEIQNKILGRLSGKNLIDNFFDVAQNRNEIGIDFIVSQLLAELYSDSFTKTILILKDLGDYEQLSEKIEKLKLNELTLQEKKQMNRFIAERKINISNFAILDDLNLQRLGVIKEFDFIECFCLPSFMI